MKRVLITGAESYLGTHIAAALQKTPDAFEVITLDVKDDVWKRESFSDVNTVLHVAGIAHQRETEETKESYYAVNRDLAIRIAEKAKADGSEQFVFFSSMSVYGMNSGRITPETEPCPANHYGRSKWMAEQAIATLQDEQFRVAVLRPPMIYGKGCKGNYPRLSKLVQKLPVFPRVQNERSMLYIGGLCGFVKRLIESGEGGLFFPQNPAYVSTDELARQIALAHGKKIWQPRGLGWLIRALSRHVGVLGKVFGSLTYDMAMSQALMDEPQLSFAETIQETEAGV